MATCILNATQKPNCDANEYIMWTSEGRSIIDINQSLNFDPTDVYAQSYTHPNAEALSNFQPKSISCISAEKFEAFKTCLFQNEDLANITTTINVEIPVTKKEPGVTVVNNNEPPRWAQNAKKVGGEIVEKSLWTLGISFTATVLLYFVKLTAVAVVGVIVAKVAVVASIVGGAIWLVGKIFGD